MSDEHDLHAISAQEIVYDKTNPGWMVGSTLPSFDGLADIKAMAKTTRFRPDLRPTYPPAELIAFGPLIGLAVSPPLLLVVAFCLWKLYKCKILYFSSN